MLMLMALLNKNSSVTRITQNKRKTLFLMWFFSLNEITKYREKIKARKTVTRLLRMRVRYLKLFSKFEFEKSLKY